MIYNVTVGFQYQINADEPEQAAGIARALLAEDIEYVNLRHGAAAMVEHAISTVVPGLDYEGVMRDIWENS